MELDGRIVEILTEPAKFKDYLRVAIHNHDQQKKAKRDWYHRNKEEVSHKRKLAYAARKGVAEGGVEKGV